MVWWYRVIIVSALSLSLRDKDRFRDWEIERAWQNWPNQAFIVFDRISSIFNNLNLFITLAKNNKLSIRATFSPRHLLAPIPKGMFLFVFSQSLFKFIGFRCTFNFGISYFTFLKKMINKSLLTLTIRIIFETSPFISMILTIVRNESFRSECFWIFPILLIHVNGKRVWHQHSSWNWNNWSVSKGSL